MNSSEESTVLDFINGIKVPGEVFKHPANEFWALICLKEGLEFIYQQVVSLDFLTKSRLNPEGKLQYFGYGNIPGTEDIPKALLTCNFHWYAISACQYVRTVGAIAYINDNSLSKPHDYLNEVIPEVLSFRDKVAAHFAWTSKNKADNDAERLASIMPPLSFVEDSWHVGALQVARSKSGNISTSESITPWSISKIHIKLSERYWPEKLNKKPKT